MTNLLEYLEKLTSMVDNGMSVDVVYLDFSKAFERFDKNMDADENKSNEVIKNPENDRFKNIINNKTVETETLWRRNFKLSKNF